MPRRKVGIRTVAPSSDWSEMLKHLWRSLIAVRRHARLTPAEQMYWLQTEQYKIQRNQFNLMVEAGERNRLALVVLKDALAEATR